MQNQQTTPTGTPQITGLTSAEAAVRLKQYGPNSITEQSGRSPLRILLRQFNSPMMWLLAMAATVSFAFHEYLDGSAILIVMGINVLIAFWMEWQAERSMHALKQMVILPARVIRDGQTIEIPAAAVVPGDVLFVEAGDMIAADAWILESAQLQTDEATLTGESLPVSKRPDVMSPDTPLAERHNMLFKGTYVTRGNGYATVEATGMRTELGKIAHLVQKAQQAATPLEKKLEILSRKLIWVTIGLLAAIVIVGLYQQVALPELINTAIAMAVAAIPEGLPIVATLALARGMLKMAKHNVLIKRLAAVETLGGTDIICTDKTGTLTQNRIEVSTILFENASIELRDEVVALLRFHVGEEHVRSDAFRRMMEIGVLCSTAEYVHTGQGSATIGDPLETSLLRCAAAAGIDIAAVRTEHQRVNLIPFTSETKMMLTQHRAGPRQWTAAKGALEEILHHCAYILEDGNINELTESQRRQWLRKGEELGEKGMRLLGFAWKEDRKPDLSPDNLVFIGVIGFLDPPVAGIREALTECRHAGISVKMVTGDHPSTARTIAAELELTDSQDASLVLGKDMKPLDQLTPEEKQRWTDVQIFARVSPAQKLDLVTVLQEQGHVIAVTGDGVNDAPALKKADIGVAMGIRGTQVAQEVADMILKDDSFTSIVRAIRQGRIIFENIRKFVVYLLSSNLSELMVVATAALLNLHFQLLPLQILFINLISDVLPALALGMGRGSRDVMKFPPRNPEEPIINGAKWASIWVYAAVMAFCTLAGVWLHHTCIHPGDTWDPRYANNIMFFSLIGAQLIHVFNMSEGRSFFKGEEFRNRYVWWSFVINGIVIAAAYLIPQVNEALYLGSMTIEDVGVIAGVTMVSFIINRGLKVTGVLK